MIITFFMGSFGLFECTVRNFLTVIRCRFCAFFFWGVSLRVVEDDLLGDRVMVGHFLKEKGIR
jgi:hypothetical protein